MSQSYDPYRTPPVDYQTTPRKSSAWIWLLLAVVLGGGVLMCCGGLGGVAYFGLNIIGEDVANQLRDHPKVQQELGGIEKINFNWTKSGASDDDNEYVFDVKGPKGSGTLTCKTNDTADGVEIITASLRTADGQTHHLVPEAELPLP